MGDWILKIDLKLIFENVFFTFDVIFENGNFLGIFKVIALGNVPDT